MGSEETATEDKSPAPPGVGDCVEVFGLTSETGQLMNGQKGVIKQFIEDKGRFEVRFVPEKLVNLKPENLRKLNDKERFDSILNQLLAGIAEPEVVAQIQRLRKDCGSEEQYNGERNTALGPLYGAIFERHAVDLGWYLYFQGVFAEDEEVKKRNAEYDKMTSWMTEGPMGLKNRDCVEVSGLEPESGKEHLNGQKGCIKRYLEDKGKFEVCFVPECANILPENLRKLDDRERFDSLQNELLECLEDNQGKIDGLRSQCANPEHFGGEIPKLLPGIWNRVFERHGVEWGWYEHFKGAYSEDEAVSKRNAKFDELTSFGTLGPLAITKGTCVEVSGLESDSGKAMNGLKGLAVGYDADKGRYEIRFSEEKSANLKPANIRALDDWGKFESIQEQLLELMTSPAIVEQVRIFREKCTNVAQYERSFSQVRAKFQEPICVRHGVDLGWFMAKAFEYGLQDEGIAKKQEQIFPMFGGLGSANLEKGSFHEITGLESEAGKKMNGMAVQIMAWNADKGRYDVAPPDDLSNTKAIKPDNLTPIPEKSFNNMEEAFAFAITLKEAYSEPENTEVLAKLQAKFPNRQHYIAALKPRILLMQKPVLEKFGFRTDFVGQSHMVKQLGIFENLSPELNELNKETERILGLPPR